MNLLKERGSIAEKLTIGRMMRVVVLRHGETSESPLINPETSLSLKGIATMKQAAAHFLIYLKNCGVQAVAVKPYYSRTVRAKQSLNEFTNELDLLAKDQIKLVLLEPTSSDALTAKGDTIRLWSGNGIPQPEALRMWSAATREEHLKHGSKEPEKLASPIFAMIGNLYKDLELDPFKPGPDFVPLLVTHDTTHVALMKVLQPETTEAPHVPNGGALIIEIGNIKNRLSYVFGGKRVYINTD